MRKIFLCLTIILAFAVHSSADVKTFGPLSVESPSGWTASQQGSAVVIKSSRSNASVTVAVNPMGEASIGDIAGKLCEQMNGRDLERDSDGDYTFWFTNHAGAECFALLTDAGDGRYILMSAAGLETEDERIRAEIEAIIDSLEWNE